MTYQYLKDNGLILLEVIVGSQAYGTATPQSDIDKKFVYILPEEDILGNKYVEQITVNKDFAGYEIKRFLELLAVGNPTMSELIGEYPKECILYKHPAFDLILNQREKFITKKFKDSYAGYAKSQITKATGLNKMQNWETKRVTRKTPIDFCYVIEGHKSVPLKRVLKFQEWDQKFCGLVKIPHTAGNYALFYDWDADKCFNKKTHSSTIMEKNKQQLKKAGKPVGLGYKGIEIENSAKVRLSSVPKSENSSYVIFYNENGYSMYCVDFKRYQTWLQERNVNRYVTNKEHGQGYDSKNLMHLKRLLDMSKEVAQGKGINVRRPNVEELMQIRNGEVSLEKILHNANVEIKEIDSLFLKSNLPESVDPDLINSLLIQIRKEFYGKHALTY